MRKAATILIFMAFALTLQAQEDNAPKLSPAAPDAIDEEYLADREFLNGMVPVASFEAPNPGDSLHLPPLDCYGRVITPRHWWYPMFGSFGGWQLHEGMNFSAGLSAFTSFGKNSFNGWGQNLSAVYAKPLDDKWSVAIGGYLNNLSTNRGTLRSAGITGVLSYRFNEHWEAYVYGQKAFADNSSALFNHYNPYFGSPYGFFPYPTLYDMGMMGDRIGAGVNWTPNESTSISIQFEYSNYPDNFHNRIHDRWAMPQPKTQP